jgi:assimilatory nitrate reductase catalytic subunit
VSPPDGVRSDLDVMAGLAERLDSPVPFETDPEAVFAELGRASAGGRADYAGITYDRIRDEHGVFWPCPTADHAGTPRMFTDSFATPDGRARFVAVEHRGPAEVPDATYPLHLTTGRVLAQYQSGAQTRRVRDLPDDGPFVEMHPMLATRIGAYDGEPVVVTTRRGEFKAPARIVSTIRPDTVFVPFHWVGANRLTHDALDPASRMPEFKACACAVGLDTPSLVPRDGYSTNESLVPRDGYSTNEGLVPRDGYSTNEGLVPRDGYSTNEGLVPRDGYSTNESLVGRVASASERIETPA